jgi:hypothetical protein
MSWRIPAVALPFVLIVACERGPRPANKTAGQVEESVDALRARAAQQDSELAVYRRHEQESALVAGQTRELSQMVAQIDSELSKVRLDASNARANAESCEGEGCAKAQGERVRERVRLLVARVRRAESQMRATAKQLSTMNKEDSLLKQQVADLEGTISNLRGITERQQQELDRINGELTSARAENVTLTASNTKLQHTIDSTATVADSVFVIAAPKATLLKLGVVEEKGGSKFAFGRGKTLVPVASPPRSAFKALSRSRDTVIALPNAKKWYALVSHQSRSLMHAAAMHDKRVSGQLTIQSPSEFWSASRYLILEER